MAPGTDAFCRGSPTRMTAQSKGRKVMRYFIAWLLGVPISVLLIIWLIWG